MSIWLDSTTYSFVVALCFSLQYNLSSHLLKSKLNIIQVVYLKINVFNIKQEHGLKLLIISLCGGVGMPIFFIGVKYIPASIGSLIFNINPIFVAFIAFIFLHEQITRLKLFAVLGSFWGVVLFILGKNQDNKEYEYYYFGLLQLLILFNFVFIDVIKSFV